MPPYNIGNCPPSTPHQGAHIIQNLPCCSRKTRTISSWLMPALVNLRQCASQSFAVCPLPGDVAVDTALWLHPSPFPRGKGGRRGSRSLPLWSPIIHYRVFLARSITPARWCHFRGLAHQDKSKEWLFSSVICGVSDWAFAVKSASRWLVVSATSYFYRLLRSW